MHNNDDFTCTKTDMNTIYGKSTCMTSLLDKNIIYEKSPSNKSHDTNEEDDINMIIYNYDTTKPLLQIFDKILYNELDKHYLIHAFQIYEKYLHQQKDKYHQHQQFQSWHHYSTTTRQRLSTLRLDHDHYYHHHSGHLDQQTQKHSQVQVQIHHHSQQDDLKGHEDDDDNDEYKHQNQHQRLIFHQHSVSQSNQESYKKVKRQQENKGNKTNNENQIQLSSPKKSHDNNNKDFITLFTKDIKDIINYTIKLIKHNKLDLCIRILDKCLELLISKRYGYYPSLLVYLYNKLACYYRRLNKLQISLMYLEKAIELIDHHKQVHYTGMTYINISAIMSQLGNHQSALDHAKKAVVECSRELEVKDVRMMNEEGMEGEREEGEGVKGEEEREGEGEQDEEVMSGVEYRNKVIMLAIAYNNLGMEESYNGDIDSSIKAYCKAYKVIEDNLDHGEGNNEKNCCLISKFRSIYEQAKKKHSFPYSMSSSGGSSDNSSSRMGSNSSSSFRRQRRRRILPASYQKSSFSQKTHDNTNNKVYGNRVILGSKSRLGSMTMTMPMNKQGSASSITSNTSAIMAMMNKQHQQHLSQRNTTMSMPMPMTMTMSMTMPITKQSPYGVMTPASTPIDNLVGMHRVKGIEHKAKEIGHKARRVGQRAEGLGQRVEESEQRVERLGQRAEGLGQKAEGLGQRVEGLGQKPRNFLRRRKEEEMNKIGIMEEDEEKKKKKKGEDKSIGLKMNLKRISSGKSLDYRMIQRPWLNLGMMNYNTVENRLKDCDWKEQGSNVRNSMTNEESLKKDKDDRVNRLYGVVGKSNGYANHSLSMMNRLIDESDLYTPIHNNDNNKSQMDKDMNHNYTSKQLLIASSPKKSLHSSNTSTATFTSAIGINNVNLHLEQNNHSSRLKHKKEALIRIQRWWKMMYMRLRFLKHYYQGRYLMVLSRYMFINMKKKMMKDEVKCMREVRLIVMYCMRDQLLEFCMKDYETHQFYHLSLHYPQNNQHIKASILKQDLKAFCLRRLKDLEIHDDDNKLYFKVSNENSKGIKGHNVENMGRLDVQNAKEQRVKVQKLKEERTKDSSNEPNSDESGQSGSDSIRNMKPVVCKESHESDGELGAGYARLGVGYGEVDGGDSKLGANKRRSRGGEIRRFNCMNLERTRLKELLGRDETIQDGDIDQGPERGCGIHSGGGSRLMKKEPKKEISGKELVCCKNFYYDEDNALGLRVYVLGGNGLSSGGDGLCNNGVEGKAQYGGDDASYIISLYNYTTGRNFTDLHVRSIDLIECQDEKGRFNLERLLKVIEIDLDNEVMRLKRRNRDDDDDDDEEGIKDEEEEEEEEGEEEEEEEISLPEPIYPLDEVRRANDKRFDSDDEEDDLEGDEDGPKHDKKGLKRDEDGLKRDKEGLKRDKDGLKRDKKGLKHDEKGLEHDEEDPEHEEDRFEFDEHDPKCDKDEVVYGYGTDIDAEGVLGNSPSQLVDNSPSKLGGKVQNGGDDDDDGLGDEDEDDMLDDVQPLINKNISMIGLGGKEVIEGRNIKAGEMNIVDLYKIVKTNKHDDNDFKGNSCDDSDEGNDGDGEEADLSNLSMKNPLTINAVDGFDNEIMNTNENLHGDDNLLIKNIVESPDNLKHTYDTTQKYNLRLSDGKIYRLIMEYLQEKHHLKLDFFEENGSYLQTLRVPIQDLQMHAFNYNVFLRNIQQLLLSRIQYQHSTFILGQPNQLLVEQFESMNHLVESTCDMDNVEYGNNVNLKEPFGLTSTMRRSNKGRIRTLSSNEDKESNDITLKISKIIEPICIKTEIDDDKGCLTYSQFMIESNKPTISLNKTLSESSKTLYKALTESNKGLSKRMNDSNKGMSDYSHKGMNDSHKWLSDSYKGLSESLKGLSESHKGLSDSNKRLSDSNKRLSDSNKGLSDSNKRLSDSHKGLSDSSKRLSDSNKVQSESHKGLSDSHKGLSDSHKEQNDSHKGQSDLQKGPNDPYKGSSDSHKVPSDSQKGPNDSHKGSSDSHKSPSDSHKVLSDPQKVLIESHKAMSDSCKFSPDFNRLLTESSKAMTDSSKVLSDSKKLKIEGSQTIVYMNKNLDDKRPTIKVIGPSIEEIDLELQNGENGGGDDAGGISSASGTSSTSGANGIDGPTAGIDGPTAGNGGSNAGNGEPNAGTSGPNAGTGEPNAGTGGPNAGTDGPNAGTGGPNAGNGGLDGDGGPNTGVGLGGADGDEEFQGISKHMFDHVIQTITEIPDVGEKGEREEEEEEEDSFQLSEKEKLQIKEKTQMKEKEKEKTQVKVNDQDQSLHIIQENTEEESGGSPGLKGKSTMCVNEEKSVVNEENRNCQFHLKQRSLLSLLESKTSEIINSRTSKVQDAEVHQLEESSPRLLKNSEELIANIEEIAENESVNSLTENAGGIDGNSSSSGNRESHLDSSYAYDDGNGNADSRMEFHHRDNTSNEAIRKYIKSVGDVSEGSELMPSQSNLLVMKRMKMMKPDVAGNVSSGYRGLVKNHTEGDDGDNLDGVMHSYLEKNQSSYKQHQHQHQQQQYHQSRFQQLHQPQQHQQIHQSHHQQAHQPQHYQHQQQQQYKQYHHQHHHSSDSKINKPLSIMMKYNKKYYNKDLGGKDNQLQHHHHHPYLLQQQQQQHQHPYSHHQQQQQQQHNLSIDDNGKNYFMNSKLLDIRLVLSHHSKFLEAIKEEDIDSKNSKLDNTF